MIIINIKVGIDGNLYNQLPKFIFFLSFIQWSASKHIFIMQWRTAMGMQINWKVICLTSSTNYKVIFIEPRALVCCKKISLLAEVSHDEAKMRERRETSAGFRRVSYHACAGVSLTTSDVFLTCDTTHRTGLRAKLQLKVRVCCGEFFAVWNNAENSTISQIWGKRVTSDTH